MRMCCAPSCCRSVFSWSVVFHHGGGQAVLGCRIRSGFSQGGRCRAFRRTCHLAAAASIWILSSRAFRRNSGEVPRWAPGGRPREDHDDGRQVGLWRFLLVLLCAGSSQEAILLGELIPEKAIEYKQTLQASNELVTLGSSPTMSNSYTVHLHRVCIMVCCYLLSRGAAALLVGGQGLAGRDVVLSGGEGTYVALLSTTAIAMSLPPRCAEPSPLVQSLLSHHLGIQCLMAQSVCTGRLGARLVLWVQDACLLSMLLEVNGHAPVYMYKCTYSHEPRLLLSSLKPYRPPARPPARAFAWSAGRPSSDRPADRPTARPIDRPVDVRPSARSTARPPVRLIDRPAGRPSVRAPGRPAARPFVRSLV